MAEALVKTFKRHYVYVNRLPSAGDVIAQLPGARLRTTTRFIRHKRLRIRSSQEYLRAVS
jgi:hypothetical protein